MEQLEKVKHFVGNFGEKNFIITLFPVSISSTSNPVLMQKVSRHLLFHRQPSQHLCVCLFFNFQKVFLSIIFLETLKHIHIV